MSLTINGGNGIYPGMVSIPVVSTIAQPNKQAIKLFDSTGYCEEFVITVIDDFNFTFSLPATTKLKIEDIENDAECITTDEHCVFPGTNMRFKHVVGERRFGQSLPDQGWIASNWAPVMADAMNITAHWQAHVRPVIGASMRWRDMLVDHNQFMTPAEVGDHTHPNWLWNQPGRDGVTEALNSSILSTNDAYLSLVLSDTASGSPRSVPGFVVSQGLSYPKDGDANSPRLKFWDPLAVDYSINFHKAVLQKYGNHPRLHSIFMGEYWRGSVLPPDYNQAADLNGRKQVWDSIIPNSPLDANGCRVTVMQVHPLYGQGVTEADLFAAGLGLAQPDPDLWKHSCGQNGEMDTNSCAVGTASSSFQSAYNSAPIMASQDASYVRRQKLSGPWPSPNIWGHPGGLQKVSTIPEVHAYRKTTVRMHAMMYNLDEGGVYTNVWDKAAFLDALTRFGPGGTDTALIGGPVPEPFPGIS